MSGPDSHNAIDPVILASVERYIDQECPDPETPFWPEGDTCLNIIDLHREMLQGTTIGRRAAEAWRRLEKDHDK